MYLFIRQLLQYKAIFLVIYLPSSQKWRKIPPLLAVFLAFFLILLLEDKYSFRKILLLAKVSVINAISFVLVCCVTVKCIYRSSWHLVPSYSYFILKLKHILLVSFFGLNFQLKKLFVDIFEIWWMVSSMFVIMWLNDWYEHKMSNNFGFYSTWS